MKGLHFSIYQGLTDVVSQEVSKEISATVKKKAHFEEKEKDYNNKIHLIEERIERANNWEKDLEEDISKLEVQNKEMAQNLQDNTDREDIER